MELRVDTNKIRESIKAKRVFINPVMELCDAYDRATKEVERLKKHSKTCEGLLLNHVEIFKNIDSRLTLGRINL